MVTHYVQYANNMKLLLIQKPIGSSKTHWLLRCLYIFMERIFLF